MLPPKPNPLDVTVIKARIEKQKDEKHEDGRFKLTCLQTSNGINGWVWCGILVKDLFRGKEWYKILPTLKPLYLALHGGWNNTLEVEVWYQKKWHTIWCASNDFNTFTEDKKSSDEYTNFIIKEGKKIMKFLDEGKSFKYIKEKLNTGHSGNTYGCAWSYGFSKTKNKNHRDIVRKEYNISEGGTGEEKGTINPAILVIGGEKNES